jgi:site-specific DNA recombinase
MRAAIYARVSTERQGREQTIASQVTLLQEWVRTQGHELLPAHRFIDEGYSGARLDRPGLDRLRDAVQDAAIDVVAVLSPDRLARKYAYQVILLEEFQQRHCELVFLQRPLSDDPNDQLLLQIQGAIAEYERALLGERFRRGKLQKAREGHFIGGRAPYGYRYIPKQEGIPGHLLIDEAEATFVRMLYTWLIDERMTSRQLLKRLNAGPWLPRSGKKPWSAATVHHILTDPIYTGTAYTNRYRFVPPTKPRTPHRSPNPSFTKQPRPREEWIAIPVPAVIDQQTHDLAVAQLARNATLSFRHNTKRSYLLRCLLRCQSCGLAMCGITHKAGSRHGEVGYYVCSGKDLVYSARTERCRQRRVRMDELDATVWEHLCTLLRAPAQLLAQFEAFAQRDPAGGEAQAEKVAIQVARLAREEQRLIDAYQGEVISLNELRQRRERLQQQREALERQRAAYARQREQAARAQEVLTDLTAFVSG